MTAGRQQNQIYPLVQWVLLERVNSSWMMQTLMLLTDLPVPETWIQSSPSGTSCIAVSTLTRLSADRPRDEWCLNPGLGGHSSGDITISSGARPDVQPANRYTRGGHTHHWSTLWVGSASLLIFLLWFGGRIQSSPSQCFPLIDLTLFCGYFVSIGSTLWSWKVESGLLGCFLQGYILTNTSQINTFAVIFIEKLQSHMSSKPRPNP